MAAIEELQTDPLVVSGPAAGSCAALETATLECRSSDFCWMQDVDTVGDTAVHRDLGPVEGTFSGRGVHRRSVLPRVTAQRHQYDVDRQSTHRGMEAM